MPCRDYGSDDYSSSRSEYSRTAASMAALKTRADMLARIACRLSDVIEESNDPALKAAMVADAETAKWLKLHRAADRLAKEQELKAQAKKAAEEAARLAAFEKLSDEEVAAFGLKRPKPPKAPAAKKRGRSVEPADHYL